MAQFDSILEQSIIKQNNFERLVESQDYDVIDIIGNIPDEDLGDEDLENLDVEDYIK